MVLAEYNYVHSAYVSAASILGQNWNDHDRQSYDYGLPCGDLGLGLIPACEPSWLFGHSGDGVL